MGSIRIGHVGGPAAGLVAVGDTRLVLWTGAALLILATFGKNIWLGSVDEQ